MLFLMNISLSPLLLWGNNECKTAIKNKNVKPYILKKLMSVALN